MTGKLNLLRHLGICFALLLGLCCLSTVLGQSGRRTPKTKTVAAPIPEPEPTPPPVKPASRPAIILILGMEQPDGFSGVSLNSISGVRRSCAQRLDEPESVRVEVARDGMSRGDAIKRAKAEKDSHVVWLRLRDDTMGGRQQGDPNNIAVEYTVFSPVTAKVFTSGTTYPQNRNSNVVLGRRTSDIDGDYYLNKAARDAADRILAKFSLSSPRRQPLAVMN